ncbi:MAG TPA: precorrin-2 C(20)-methyltransferase [Candidatus Merdenecus merdavium]|nr:precorrin-2 C(20)-methyltransferase [Candidatus Merdenecus merdavium]
MKGKLYGVGVGPGDPEYLTLKAVRLIKECDIIAIPGKDKERCTAYEIVKKGIPQIEEKEILPIHIPMTKDKQLLEEHYEIGKDRIISMLKKGKNIAFLTLGDPTVYSTYMYIHSKVLKEGYEGEIISGVTSFCAASARLNQSLVERSESLHIIPASYGIEDALKLSGTKVLMKSGKQIKEVKEELVKKNIEAMMVENCGMKNEKIYDDTHSIPNHSGYYSLIIIKEK